MRMGLCILSGDFSFKYDGATIHGPSSAGTGREGFHTQGFSGGRTIDPDEKNAADDPVSSEEEGDDGPSNVLSPGFTVGG